MSSNSAAASTSRLLPPGSIAGRTVSSARNQRRGGQAPVDALSSEDTAILTGIEDTSTSLLLDATLGIKDPGVTITQAMNTDANATLTTHAARSSSSAATAPATSSSESSNIRPPSPTNVTIRPAKRSRKRNSVAGPRSYAASHLNASGSKRASPTTALARSRLPTSSTPAIRKVSGSSMAALAVSKRAQPARVPLGSATNRNLGPASSAQPRIPSAMAQQYLAASDNGALSSNFARSTLSSSAQDGELGERVGALEDGMQTILNLVNQERQRAAHELSRLQDRVQKEDPARQVAETAISQQMSALLAQMQQIQSSVVQARRQGPRRSLEPEELEVLQLKHAKEMRLLHEELETSKETITALRNAMTQNSSAQLHSESDNAALRLQIASLQAELTAARQATEAAEAAVEQSKAAYRVLEEQLRGAESLRRKLHNVIQELRGNIRVFARVRPRSTNDERNGTEELGDFVFPECDAGDDRATIEVLEPTRSAAGTMKMLNHAFTFDRVFQPATSQEEVFEEVRYLAQSVLDGYNVSIFAYGQTGSGKTFTLEGPGTDVLDASSALPAEAGLIPRAVRMLFGEAATLAGKGWSYSFEGSILEIYCDGINDLLGKETFDKGSHDVRHDPKTGRTVVTNTVVVTLRSPEEVFKLLDKAKKRRAVAATLMNERSSRSHSVFMLRVCGQNAKTREACDAVLNLVDLAGSERLSTSGSASDPTRLREAQSINKSLSALADVIAALGAASKSGGGGGHAVAAGERVGGVHIPYRNSTLTWLLRNSLGGNAKTLMLLALSPMKAHLNESLCSLRFADKVNSTHVGAATKKITSTATTASAPAASTGAATQA